MVTYKLYPAGSIHHKEMRAPTPLDPEDRQVKDKENFDSNLVKNKNLHDHSLNPYDDHSITDLVQSTTDTVNAAEASLSATLTKINDKLRGQEESTIGSVWSWLKGTDEQTLKETANEKMDETQEKLNQVKKTIDDEPQTQKREQIVREQGVSTY